MIIRVGRARARDNTVLTVKSEDGRRDSSQGEWEKCRIESNERSVHVELKPENFVLNSRKQRGFLFVKNDPKRIATAGKRMISPARG